MEEDQDNSELRYARGHVFRDASKHSHKITKLLLNWSHFPAAYPPPCCIPGMSAAHHLLGTLVPGKLPPHPTPKSVHHNPHKTTQSSLPQWFSAPSLPPEYNYHHHYHHRHHYLNDNIWRALPACQLFRTKDEGGGSGPTLGGWTTPTPILLRSPGALLRLFSMGIGMAASGKGEGQSARVEGGRHGRLSSGASPASPSAVSCVRGRHLIA
ncbi:hypothetical protein E2C01_037642 [Portunus trituberculatus]|uniref:Uncharacterized protein n=1 Tax=Portunus trituberculatus TaxID=210409 RepID=A0A5B7FFU7_PORTR|nr:hypothetical protein [Portunus trituberculatus]